MEAGGVTTNKQLTSNCAFRIIADFQLQYPSLLVRFSARPHRYHTPCCICQSSTAAALHLCHHQGVCGHCPLGYHSAAVCRSFPEAPNTCGLQGQWALLSEVGQELLSGSQVSVLTMTAIAWSWGGLCSRGDLVLVLSGISVLRQATGARPLVSCPLPVHCREESVA